MYKKILIPTDGSSFSEQAAQAGVDFARALNAQIVALCVTQPLAATGMFDGLASGYTISEEDYERTAAEQAQECVKRVVERADAAGVKAESRVVSNFNVADGIVQVAGENGCDLIFIGSHGRSGLSRLFLGSVTAKVLPQASTSVLVYRINEAQQG